METLELIFGAYLIGAAIVVPLFLGLIAFDIQAIKEKLK